MEYLYLCYLMTIILLCGIQYWTQRRMDLLRKDINILQLQFDSWKNVEENRKAMRQYYKDKNKIKRKPKKIKTKNIPHKDI